MLFSARQFEQVFKEGTLKKGLRLFEKAKVELISKPSSLEYQFLVNGAELFLKKKGEKVLDCNCSCRRGPYCEHLSAVMFYFQSDTLGVALKAVATVKKQRSIASSAEKLFRDTLNNSGNEALYLFFRHHTPEPKDIREVFSADGEPGPADLYRLQIRTLLDPFLNAGPLAQKQIDDLCKKLTDLTDKTSRLKDGSLYFLKLAIVADFALLFNFRYTGDETRLFAIYDQAMKELDGSFREGLSQTERQAWLKVTMQSVKTNRSLISGAFVFLIPRFLNISKSKTLFERLEEQLEKRSYKSREPGSFDRLLIVRLALAIRSQELFETVSPFKNYHETPEYAIAQAELEFCRNRTDKAFKHLELKYGTLSARQKKHWEPFREYIILKACEKKLPEIELKYLKESFIFGLHIAPERLERLLELLPPAEQEQEIRTLVDKIKGVSESFSFDKTATLLSRMGKWDELVSEIRRQGNKFSLLHQVAMNKFPEYDEAFLMLYVRQLLELVSERRHHHLQEQLFGQAGEYINRLPENVRQNVISAILNKLGGQSRIHQYVAELYRQELH